MSTSLDQVLRESNRLLLLDGPLGTQLTEKGYDVHRAGWSARALWEASELVAEIHREYWEAGSRCLTANTFRLHPANLSETEKAGKSAELIELAIDLAREVVHDEGYVLGSLAPVGDCYQAEQTPAVAILEDSHFYLCEQFRQRGVDAILLETHVSMNELLIAMEAAAMSGLPYLVSVTSMDGLHLLDGSRLADFANRFQNFAPLAVGVNCLPVEVVPVALSQLAELKPSARLVYANAGRMTGPNNWEPTDGANASLHTELAENWLTAGIRLLGGCCGTNPQLIAKFSSWFAER